MVEIPGDSGTTLEAVILKFLKKHSILLHAYSTKISKLFIFVSEHEIVLLILNLTFLCLLYFFFSCDRRKRYSDLTYS